MSTPVVGQDLLGACDLGVGASGDSLSVLVTAVVSFAAEHGIVLADLLAALEGHPERVAASIRFATAGSKAFLTPELVAGLDREGRHVDTARFADALARLRERPTRDLTLAQHRQVNGRIIELEASQRAYSTSEVIGLGVGLNTAASVSSRVSRGRLVQFKIGQRAYYPRWQFDLVRQELRSVLPEIIDRLKNRFSGNVIALDTAVALPRADRDGMSVEDLLELGMDDAALAWLDQRPEHAG